MTDFHSDTDTDFSDGETIYSDSDISSDESMHTSDEDFIDDSVASIEVETESSTEDETESSEDESDDEYIPHKRQKLGSCEDEQKVEIKFVKGKWILNVINVSVSSS